MKRTTHKFVIKLTLITSLILSNAAMAQELKPYSSEVKMYNNSVIGSIGPGGLLVFYLPAAIYYERMFQGDILGPKISTFIDAGIGMAAYWEGNSPFFLARYGILTGKNKHHFESSAGIATFYSDYYGVTPSLSVGYRSQKPYSHYIFRTGVGWPEAIYVSWGVSF